MLHRALVLLSGCGSLDGSDPFETVLCAAALELKGFEVIYAAPSGYQLHTANHLTGNVRPKDRRRISEESGRISRGKIFSIQELSPKLAEAVFIPGGQGTFKNFFKGIGTTRPRPRTEISGFLRQAHDHKAVIAAFSLAVPFLSAVFNEYDFDFDLLQMKPGTYLVNSPLRLIAAPGSLSPHSLSSLRQEIENVVDETRSIIES
jgi:enhancing lycopene biosynthesis protein 2